MRKKTLRTRLMCALLSLVFLASLFQAELPSVEAANTATIPITVGGQTFNVTPGQWVTVNTPGGSTSYNVRFVDGKPVALEMSQYQQIIFGEAATAGTTTSGSTTSGSASQSSKPSTGSSKPSTSGSKPSTSGSSSSSANQTSGATSQSSKPASSGSSSSGAAQTSTPASSNGGQMTWNEFQKANAGKGMSGSEMSQAWKDYKASNGTGAGSTNSGAAQTSTNTGSTNTTQAAQTSGATAQTGNTPAPQTSVAEGAATTTNTGATGTGGTQASSPSSSSSQTSQTTKTWDPTKHPRDPQTGKFISHEEAIARGLMDPADATTTSSSSSQSSQTAQSGEATQAPATSAEGAQASTADGSAGVAESGASAQSAQAAQVTEGAATADGKTKPSIGDKFKSGYQTGKNLTNQGFQNVKDSLKSGFSAKNILVTAGITVGVDLATQVMRGENPSLKSALKTVCCAEFVGGVAGSTLGAAAGSFFTPFLSCIPVVGGVLSALAPTFGSVVGSSVGAYLAGDLKNGRFSIKEAFKRVDWVGVAGQTIGSTAGAALGSCLGPVGTVIGGMVGGFLGNWAAHKIAGLFGKGKADLPTISMPTGTTSSGLSTVSSISLGGSDVTSVTISDSVVPEVEEETERESVEAGSVDAEITQAYEDYTALYTEYSQLIQAGKNDEAMAVAQKMNEAKAKYDNLRYK